MPPNSRDGAIRDENDKTLSEIPMSVPQSAGGYPAPEKKDKIMLR
jgi:hypothetical protein